MVYTYIPFLGIPSHPGTKVISPSSHLTKPPSHSLTIPPGLSNMTDRCKTIFLQAMGDCLEGKTPSSLSPCPWPGSAVGQGRACLIAPTCPILSTRYCSLFPPACHLSIPLGSVLSPTLMILYRVHFCSGSSFCPSWQPGWAFVWFAFFFLPPPSSFLYIL